MHPLLENLQGLSPLDARSARDLLAILGKTRLVRSGDDLLPHPDGTGSCTVLLAGMACRYQTLWDGGRHITALYFPGDILDLDGLGAIQPVEQSLAALSRCQLAALPRDKLTRLIHERPPVRRAVWRHLLRDAAILRGWLIRSGRPASERMAHLFCEISCRSGGPESASRRKHALPLRQGDLADVLGLSVVHANRVLQGLRREKLATLKSGVLEILDWPKLQRAGAFDVAYLLDGRSAVCAGATGRAGASWAPAEAARAGSRAAL